MHADPSPTCPVGSPFTRGCHPVGVIDAMLTDLAAGPWALPLLVLLVVGDAFLVVIPGEAAVTAFGALAVATGAPPLAAVLALAAGAALLGDACCYLVGRRIGLERWRWMRTRRIRAALAWAERRLRTRTGLVLFTARFIPFARLAVNLAAGASRVPAPRYLLVAGLAACGWAAYQALIGAVVAALVPGGPVVAVAVSVVLAVALGLGLDWAVSRRRIRP
jgi:membrane protein DedA with SNARE-associated domain